VAVTLVQSQLGGYGSGAVVTPATPPTPGNLMVICAFIRGTLLGPSSIAGWTTLSPGTMVTTNGGFDRDYAMFYRFAQAGDTSWGVSTSASALGFAEFSGVGAFVGSVSEAQSTLSVTCGGAATVSSGAFLIGGATMAGINDGETTAVTPSAGVTELWDKNGASGNAYYWGGYRSVSAGTYTLGGTISLGSGLSGIPQVGITAIFSTSLAPEADFSADDNSGPAPLPVHFTDLSTNTPTSWAWTFGDGGTSTSQNPSHTYTASGTYAVSLTATNAFGSDTETKLTFITVSDNTAIPPPSPGRFIVEIYVTEEGAYKWDEATWDDAVWGGSSWQNVTPESVDCVWRWGTSRPELGILSQPDAESGALNIYDPTRLLDPANEAGPWFGQLKPGLPIRINHSSGHFGGTTIRTGIVESMGHDFKRPGFGFIRVTNAQSTYANAAVPHDTTLDDTLYTRASSAMAAAGLPVNIIAATDGDPDLVAWVDPGSDRSVWDWIKDAAQQVLWIPYFDRSGRFGFRDYQNPINRSIVLAAPELVGLLSLTTFSANFSRVVVHDEADVEVIRHVSTDYGLRTYTRSDPTPNADDWADAVISDRAFDSLFWQPGEVFAESAAHVNDYARTTAVELVNVADAFTDPNINVDVIVLGGEITVTGRASRAADWRFTFGTSQSITTPLAVTGSLPVEYVVRTGGGTTEYLFPSR